MEIVERIRAFNRFYLPAMNLLGVHYLGSEYSATEARVIFEIYENGGCNAASIARKLKIDKSYLSRILTGFVKKGYLTRRPSPEDKRSQCLYLTESGKARAKELIQKSDEDISSIIRDLRPEDVEKLCGAMDVITGILGRKEEEA